MARSEKTDVSVRPFNSKHHPDMNYVVYWPASEPGQSRKSRRFKTKEEADNFVLKKEIEVTNFGRKAASLKQREIGEVLYAIEKLEGYGVTLRDVLDDYIVRHEEIKTSMLISDAIYDFLSLKKSKELSEVYLADLRARCNCFGRDYGDKTLAEIDVPTVESWLEGLKVTALTRNNYRRVLSVFFTWGLKRGYCTGNPALDAEPAKEVNERVKIFDPGELRVMLNLAPTNLLPFLAIGAFAGLRTSELSRLRWEDVDFLKKRIDVGAEIAKGAANRYVPMKDVLIEWIQPIAKAAGDVAPINVEKKLTAFRRKLEVKDTKNNRPGVAWKQNGLRHSFASYALAESDNAAQVALWLGHASTKIIFEHYRERVTPEEAAKWFDVKPDQKKKKALTKERAAA